MHKKNSLPDDEISRFLLNTTLVTQALKKGINDALLKHKQAGNPICVWRDGKVVWIPPEEIDVDEN